MIKFEHPQRDEHLQEETFDNQPPQPPHTFLAVAAALAEPEMLIEVEVSAALPYQRFQTTDTADE